MANLDNLLKYYIECIEIESLEDLSFPSFKEEETFWQYPLAIEWSKLNEPSIAVAIPQALRSALALGGASASIYYGWPLYIRPEIAKNGSSYTWVEPVFFLKAEYEQEGSESHLTLEKEWPKINDYILRRLTDSMEDRIQLLDMLGLSEAEVLPENGLMEYRG